MPQTIEELNRRFGNTGVSIGVPSSGGGVSTIAEMNSYYEKKRKEDEERQRKEAEQRQQFEDKRRQAEERVQKKEQGLKQQKTKAESPEAKVFNEKTTIRQATPEEAQRANQKSGLWDNVKQFFGFKPEEKGIRDTLLEQEKSREELKKAKKKDDIAQIRKEASSPSEYINERLQQGALSQVGVALPAAGSVIAKKVGAVKVAEKLDVYSRENKKLLKLFTDEYLLEDKHSVSEKMRAMPIRTAIGMIAQTAPSLAGAGAALVAGGAASVAGASAATITAAAAITGMATGGLFNFGSAYSDARDFVGENGETLGEDEAEKIGLWVALLSAPIDVIPEVRLVGKVGGKPFLSNVIRKAYVKNVTKQVLNRVGRSAASVGTQAALEGIGESGQTIIENAWAKTYDENRQIFEGTEESFLAGFFTGGMMDTLVSTANSINNQVRSDTLQDPQGLNGLRIEESTPESIIFTPPDEEPPPGSTATVEPVTAPVEVPTTKQTQADGESDTDFAQRFLKEQPGEFRKNYLARVQQEFKSDNVVSGDEGKFAIPGFDATKSAAYHEPASQFAKEYGKELLARTDTAEKPVLILAGGSGAGKSSGLELSVKKYGKDLSDYAAVHDTNISSVKAGTDRIEAALDSGRRVVVQYTWRDPIEAFSNGVVPRVKTQNRIVPLDVHVQNHIGAREAIDALVEKYKGEDGVEFRFVDNSNGKGKTKLIPFEKLPKMPYNEAELKSLLYDELTKAKESGAITEAQFATFVGETQANGGQPSSSDSGRSEQPSEAGKGVVDQAREAAAKGTRKAQTPRTGEGIMRESGLARKVKAEAVKARITTAFERLPQFETVNLAQQAERATELLQTDYGLAKSIALGQEDAPSGIRARAVFEAVKEQAIQDRDAVTLRDLATYSTVPYEESLAAQTVGLARLGSTNDPVVAIRQVREAREVAIKKKLKGKSVAKVTKQEVAAIRKEIKPVTVSKLQEFINNLQC